MKAQTEGPVNQKPIAVSRKDSEPNGSWKSTCGTWPLCSDQAPARLNSMSQVICRDTMRGTPASSQADAATIAAVSRKSGIQGASSKKSFRQRRASRSDAEVKKVVVLHVGPGLLVPLVGEALVGMRLVDEWSLVGKAPHARVDAVADQPGAFPDALGVVGRGL